MNARFFITTGEEEFIKHEGIKINYSKTRFHFSVFNIKPHNLLFENSISEQKTDCFGAGRYKTFFKTDNSDFSFDVFAASFYLLSRYEEYLPCRKDIYGRYAHENSLAFKENFLHLPLINIWVNDFAEALKNKFHDIAILLSPFNFIPTYDIDIAYSYKHKGLLRNIGGFLKSPSFERIKVLLHFQKDPFDVYEELHEMHTRKKLGPVYFFLVAAKNGLYDKNILPGKKPLQELIKQHSEKYDIAIHPSWQSGNDVSLLRKEKELLESVAGKQISRSRQHYIRFDLPHGYRNLIDAGIADDYSMGYGSINGFRASVASSFFWYDLEKEQQSSLRIHPFCFMEANSLYEQKLSPAEALEELIHYYTVCKENGGTLITVFHNHILGTDKLYEGWKDMYYDFLNGLS